MLRIRAHAGGLAAALRRRSGTCVLVCAARVAGPGPCGAGAKDNDGATGENQSFHVHASLLFFLSRAPTEQEVKETDAMVVGSGWQRVYLMGLPSGGSQFYESAIANGAIDEGAPGIRENYNANYCGAFFRDLDGNKIEAVTFTARETFE
jgi:hypothetical protein